MLCVYVQGQILTRMGDGAWCAFGAPILNRLKNINIFDELKYLNTHKSVLVSMYCSKVFNILEKTFFLQFLPLLWRKLSFYCYFNPKSIKICQGLLYLGPVDPCINQPLSMPVSKRCFQSSSNSVCAL